MGKFNNKRLQAITIIILRSILIGACYIYWNEGVAIAWIALLLFSDLEEIKHKVGL